MFFIDTAAFLPAFLAGAAGAAFWVLVLLLELLSLLLLPHPAATRPQATIEQRVAKNLVIGPPGGFRGTLVVGAASAGQELEQCLLGVEPVLGLVPDG